MIIFPPDLRKGRRFASSVLMCAKLGCRITPKSYASAIAKTKAAVKKYIQTGIGVHQGRYKERRDDRANTNRVGFRAPQSRRDLDCDAEVPSRALQLERCRLRIYLGKSLRRAFAATL